MLDLTPSEKRVILIVSGIIILAGILQLFRTSYHKQIRIDYSESDSVFSRLSSSNLNQERKYVFSKENKIKEESKYAGKKDFPQNLKLKSININTADENELKKLPRIGPAMAKRIIEFRTANGPFNSNDDLKKVKGIGNKTFERIKPYLKTIP